MPLRDAVKFCKMLMAIEHGTIRSPLLRSATRMNWNASESELFETDKNCQMWSRCISKTFFAWPILKWVLTLNITNTNTYTTHQYKLQTQLSVATNPALFTLPVTQTPHHTSNDIRTTFQRKPCIAPTSPTPCSCFTAQTNELLCWIDQHRIPTRFTPHFLLKLFT